jgi:hypothetical protein
MGSDLARAVAREGGAALARLVRELARRGAMGGEVVAAGGAITRQEALMTRAAPDWRITLLVDSPGLAPALARRIASGEAMFGLAPARREALE